MLRHTMFLAFCIAILGVLIGCESTQPTLTAPDGAALNTNVYKLPTGGGRTLLVRPDGKGRFATIQHAIDFARDGDTVLLAHGTFTGVGNRDLDFKGKAITVRSTDRKPWRTVIDCQGSESNPHRGVNFISGEGADSRLEGITIRNGWVVGDAPEGLGGAVFCYGSSPTLTNLRLVTNTAHNGGGVACREGANPIIEDCEFIDNDATTYFDGDGGGLHCSLDSSPDVYRCLFVGNAATSWGGGMFCLFNSNPTLWHCTFVGNIAGNGGGIGADRGGSTPQVNNTIIAFNLGGGAVRCQLGASAVLNCSDVYGNQGGDWVNCISGQDGANGNFSADPLFCSADTGMFGLQHGSPCLPGTTDGCGLVGAYGEECKGAESAETPVVAGVE